jgi:hypothetical protein
MQKSRLTSPEPRTARGLGRIARKARAGIRRFLLSAEGSPGPVPTLASARPNPGWVAHPSAPDWRSIDVRAVRSNGFAITVPTAEVQTAMRHRSRAPWKPRPQGAAWLHPSRAMAVAVAVAAVELSVPSAANAQSSPMYTQLDGSLKDIATCRDSRNSHEVVWGTNLDMEIYRREISSGGAGDTGWVRIPDPGRAKRVATSSDCGYVAFVGSDNCVWLSSNWPTEQPSYTRVGDFCDAIDVAVNDFGAVWAVASNNGIKRYSGSWVTVAGAAKAIDFDDGGVYPWVIGTTDAVYQALNDNGGWLHSGRPGGQFANLDIGVGGGRVVVTTSSPSATFSASECTLDSAGKCIGLWTSDQHGLDMSSVAVTDATTYWMVGRAGTSRQGQIWKAQTPASWASQFDGRATDIAACRDNRTNVEVVWAVNASDNDGSNIYRRQFNPGTSGDSGWVPISGAAKKIAASSDCRAVAVIGSDNCVYQAGDYPATSFGWTKIPQEGACDNVDVATDTHGSLYAITEANAVKVVEFRPLAESVLARGPP